jgi:hypothetical protein
VYVCSSKAWHELGYKCNDVQWETRLRSVQPILCIRGLKLTHNVDVMSVRSRHESLWNYMKCCMRTGEVYTNIFGAIFFCFISVITNSVTPEPEGLSPHSQQPANGPHPEPSEYSPHSPPANLHNVRFDRIHPSTPWSFKRSLSLGLSHQNPIRVSPLSHACHMPRPPYSPWFDLPDNIWWWVQFTKLPTVHNGHI